jgi:hypothetical protein
MTWKIQFQIVEVNDGGLALRTDEPDVQYHWQECICKGRWKRYNTGEPIHIKQDVESNLMKRRRTWQI